MFKRVHFPEPFTFPSTESLVIKVIVGRAREQEKTEKYC